VPARGQRPFAILALAAVQFGGVGLAQVENVQNRLLLKELETAQALLVVRVELQLAQRLVFLKRRLALL
jgi:hypothetical protein